MFPGIGARAMNDVSCVCRTRSGMEPIFAIALAGCRAIMAPGLYGIRCIDGGDKKGGEIGIRKPEKDGARGQVVTAQG
jgi:hypothetical protein